MKRLFLLLVALVISLTVVQPVLAQDGAPTCSIPPCVYVNSGREPTGNEDGSPVNPYNTPEEGKAYAQSLPNGGYIYVRDQTTGQWVRTYVPPARSGGMGVGLPNMTLYVILAVLAVIFILAGWKSLRRSYSLRKA